MTSKKRCRFGHILWPPQIIWTLMFYRIKKSNQVVGCNRWNLLCIAFFLPPIYLIELFKSWQNVYRNNKCNIRNSFAFGFLLGAISSLSSFESGGGGVSARRRRAASPALGAQQRPQQPQLPTSATTARSSVATHSGPKWLKPAEKWVHLMWFHKYFQANFSIFTA